MTAASPPDHVPAARQGGTADPAGVQTGIANPAAPHGARVMAALVDFAVLWLATAVILATTRGVTLPGGVPVTGFATLGFLALYAVLLPAGAGTVGKRVAGLRIETMGGERLTLGRAALRAGALLVAVLPLGAGLLVAAVTRQRRGLHDLVAGTRVVVVPR